MRAKTLSSLAPRCRTAHVRSATRRRSTMNPPGSLSPGFRQTTPIAAEAQMTREGRLAAPDEAAQP